MGGIIGMFLASLPNSPIRKLVLNDVGAYVAKEALIRIAEYVSKPPPSFDSVEDATQYFKRIHKVIICLSSLVINNIISASLLELKRKIGIILCITVQKLFLTKMETQNLNFFMILPLATLSK